MVGKLLLRIKAKGFSGILFSALRKVFPIKLRGYSLYRDVFVHGKGLEIGGPSGVFGKKGIVPVYPDAESLDNCNYAHDTLWEGRLNEGKNFHFSKGKEPGFQFVAEASELNCIPDAGYDYILSSHCLEHLANPLKGIFEWRRILKENGLLVLIVPDRMGTFDHRRPVTSLEHIVNDFEAGVGEDDLTHLQEILDLHDFDRDPEAGGYDKFSERSKFNLNNRCMHHHVFDEGLVVDVVRRAKFAILQVEKFRPYHIVLIARKSE